MIGTGIGGIATIEDPAHGDARARAGGDVAAVRAADDAQRRRRRGRDAPRAARASATAPSRPAPPAPRRSAPGCGWSSAATSTPASSAAPRPASPPLAVAAFAGMGATSKLGISRPFDRRRDGFVIGEGAGDPGARGRRARGRARGAESSASLTGYGATADAYHLTAPDPEGDGAARAMQAALRDAGVEPGEVDYVNAHGTSTPLNDRSETEAIKRVFGERAGSIPVSSLKSSIGHLLGAAGAVEAVATVQALRGGGRAADDQLERARRGARPRLRPRRVARRWSATAARRSRSRTRSASAATTSSSASRRSSSAWLSPSPPDPPARPGSTPIARLEALCDPGSFRAAAHRRSSRPRRRARAARRRGARRRRARSAAGRSSATPGSGVHGRLAGRGARGDDRQGDAARRPGGSARGRLRRVRRRPAAGGPRRARRLRADLPRERRALAAACRRSRSSPASRPAAAPTRRR